MDRTIRKLLLFSLMFLCGCDYLVGYGYIMTSCEAIGSLYCSTRDSEGQYDFKLISSIMENIKNYNAQPQLMLRINYSTNRNLANLFSSSRYLLSAYFAFCSDIDEKSASQDSDTPKLPTYVLLNSKILNEHLGNESAPQDNSNDRKNIYYSYMPVAYEKSGWPSMTSYNLLENPRDICFWISGNSGFGYFSSNVIKITKEEIEKNIEEYKKHARP